MKSTTYFSKSFKREAVVENGTALPIQYRVTIPLGTVNMEWIIEAGQLQDQQFLLTDHLGSTSTIIDKDGNVKEKLSFDPWGLRRNSDWTPPVEKISSASPRGYTGHEMDDEMSLVNMNARIYDPVLGRFLSPDSVLPDASNMQAFNRYAYVNNNPLSGTDPTGHVTAPSYAYYLEHRKQLYFNEGRGGYSTEASYHCSANGGGCKSAGHESYDAFAERTLKFAAGTNPDGTMITRREANRRNHAAQDRARDIAGCPTCTGSQLYAIAFDGASHGMTASQFDAFKSEIEASYYLRLYSQFITRKRQSMQWVQGVITLASIAYGGGFDSSQAFGEVLKDYAVNAAINEAGEEIGVSNLSTWVNVGQKGLGLYNGIVNPTLQDVAIENFTIGVSVNVSGGAAAAGTAGYNFVWSGGWDFDFQQIEGGGLNTNANVGVSVNLELTNADSVNDLLGPGIQTGVSVGGGLFGEAGAILGNGYQGGYWGLGFGGGIFPATGSSYITNTE